jgi:S1-C subfamily serine protease
VTTRGDVVGVNTAIYSRSGGNEGIGFALPTTYVRALVARARGKTAPDDAADAGDGAGKKALRVSLGARVEDYDRLGYAGVRIVAVQEGGACARAGLRGVEDAPPKSVKHKGMPWTGHIITAVDGKSIHDTGELRAALAKLAPGDKVKLSVTVGPGRTKQKVTLRFPK